MKLTRSISYSLSTPCFVSSSVDSTCTNMSQVLLIFSHSLFNLLANFYESTVSISNFVSSLTTENSFLTLFDWMCPMKCHSMSFESYPLESFSTNSSTQFSPKNRCPPSYAPIISSKGLVFDTATSLQEVVFDVFNKVYEILP